MCQDLFICFYKTGKKVVGAKLSKKQILTLSRSAGFLTHSGAA
jgi:hypothetical protein